MLMAQQIIDTGDIKKLLMGAVGARELRRRQRQNGKRKPKEASDG